MIVKFLGKPFVVLEGLNPRFGPILERPLKMRAVWCGVEFAIDNTSSGEGLGFFAKIRVEHYYEDDDTKTTIKGTEGNIMPEQPYDRRVSLAENATAYRKLSDLSVVKPANEEELQAIIDSSDEYMNEYQWMVRKFSQEPVIIKTFITMMLTNFYNRGLLY
jgi:hypothetical protein